MIGSPESRAFIWDSAWVLLNMWPVWMALAAACGLCLSVAGLLPSQQINDLAYLQTLEDCAAACDPRAPELVEGACYCRTDLVAP